MASIFITTRSLFFAMLVVGLIFTIRMKVSPSAVGACTPVVVIKSIWVKSPYQTTIGLKPFPYGRPPTISQGNYTTNQHQRLHCPKYSNKTRCGTIPHPTYTNPLGGDPARRFQRYEFYIRPINNFISPKHTTHPYTKTKAYVTASNTHCPHNNTRKPEQLTQTGRTPSTVYPRVDTKSDVIRKHVKKPANVSAHQEYQEYLLKYNIHRNKCITIISMAFQDIRDNLQARERRRRHHINIERTQNITTITETWPTHHKVHRSATITHPDRGLHTAYTTSQPNHNSVTCKHVENDEISGDAQGTHENEHTFQNFTTLHQQTTSACSNAIVNGLDTNITTDAHYSNKLTNKTNGGKPLRQSQPGKSLTAFGNNFSTGHSGCIPPSAAPIRNNGTLPFTWFSTSNPPRENHSSPTHKHAQEATQNIYPQSRHTRTSKPTKNHTKTERPFEYAVCTHKQDTYNSFPNKTPAQPSQRLITNQHHARKFGDGSLQLKDLLETWVEQCLILHKSPNPIQHTVVKQVPVLNLTKINNLQAPHEKTNAKHNANQSWVDSRIEHSPQIISRLEKKTINKNITRNLINTFEFLDTLRHRSFNSSMQTSISATNHFSPTNNNQPTMASNQRQHQPLPLTHTSRITAIPQNQSNTNNMSDKRQSPRLKKNSAKERYVSFFHLFSTHQQFIWVKYPYQITIGLKPFPNGRQNSIQLQYNQQQNNNQPLLGIKQIKNTPHTHSCWNISIRDQNQTHNRGVHKVQRRKGTWTQVEEAALLGNQIQTPTVRDTMDLDSTSPAAVVQQSPGTQTSLSGEIPAECAAAIDETTIDPLAESPPSSSSGNSAEGSISEEAYELISFQRCRAHSSRRPNSGRTTST